MPNAVMAITAVILTVEACEANLARRRNVLLIIEKPATEAACRSKASKYKNRRGD